MPSTGLTLAKLSRPTLKPDFAPLLTGCFCFGMARTHRIAGSLATVPGANCRGPASSSLLTGAKPTAASVRGADEGRVGTHHRAQVRNEVWEPGNGGAERLARFPP